MIVLRSLKGMSALSQKIRRKGLTLSFVPTMGALHEGHLSLIRRARKDCDKLAVSIFVNPAQFGPKEDFKNYPRSFRRDVRLCRKSGVDIIFYPQAKEMYPPDYKTYVTVEGLSDVLCGKSRTGHFRGVTTVVAKLFNIVQPEIAYFGQKDAQQAMILKKMATDLNLPVKINVLPTVREKNGLALSSRNAYLSAKERKDAPALSYALRSARSLIKSGVRDADKVIRLMRKIIAEKKTARVDYISIVDLETLRPVKKISGKSLIALAAWFGKTRLIDNIIWED